MSESDRKSGVERDEQGKILSGSHPEIGIPRNEQGRFMKKKVGGNNTEAMESKGGQSDGESDKNLKEGPNNRGRDEQGRFFTGARQREHEGMEEEGGEKDEGILEGRNRSAKCRPRDEQGRFLPQDQA